MGFRVSGLRFRSREQRMWAATNKGYDMWGILTPFSVPVCPWQNRGPKLYDSHQAPSSDNSTLVFEDVGILITLAAESVG